MPSRPHVYRWGPHPSPRFPQLSPQPTTEHPSREGSAAGCHGNGDAEGQAGPDHLTAPGETQWGHSRPAQPQLFPSKPGLCLCLRTQGPRKVLPPIVFRLLSILYP